MFHIVVFISVGLEMKPRAKKYLSLTNYNV